MAKSLGQIHSVNFTPSLDTVNQRFNMDLPGELTSQLNRMIRAGTFHKVVGIDIGVDPVPLGAGLGGQITGRLLYYQPTRGRCAAYRAAFKSMSEVMKTQGISMRDNIFYDFKMPINDDFAINTFQNQATLDGSNGLTLNDSGAGSSVFGVHNTGVQPVTTATGSSVFTAGFDTLVQTSGGTDFVLNDNIPFSGNDHFANTDYEFIPFSVVFDPGSGTVSNFQWRPDPALYLAILCGQIQLVVDEVKLVGGAQDLRLNINVMVSGWKSIMGNPDKKPRRRMKAKTSGKKKV